MKYRGLKPVCIGCRMGVGCMCVGKELAEFALVDCSWLDMPRAEVAAHCCVGIFNKLVPNARRVEGVLCGLGAAEASCCQDTELGGKF